MLHSIYKQRFKLFCQPAVFFTFTSIRANIVNEEQGQRLHALGALKVLSLGLEMTLNGKPYHLFLIGLGIDRWAEMLAGVEFLTIRQCYQPFLNRFHTHVLHFGRQRDWVACLQNLRLISILQSHLALALIYFFYDDALTLFTLQFKVLFGHAFNKILRKSLAGIQVVKQIQIILNYLFVFTTSYRCFGEGGAIPYD